MDQKASGAARRGSGRLPANEAVRLPDRLLDAAIAVFIEHGYAQASMDRIAGAAGASTKTVYGRYRNKDEILDAAVRRMIERTVPSVTIEFDEARDDVDTRAFLTVTGERLAALATRREALGIYRLVVAESPRFPDLARLYAQGSGRIVANLARLFEHWAKIGRLSSRNKPEGVAMTFLDLVVATPRNKAVIGMPLGRAALKAHVAVAVDLFLRGCGPRDE